MRLARLVYRLTVPGGIILLLMFSLVRLGLITSAETGRIQLVTLTVLAVALALSAAFRRSRLFLASLVIALSHLALVWLPSVSPQAKGILLRAIALLVPLNLLGFACLKDRGIASPAGERRLAFVAVQVLVIGLLMRPRFAYVATLLDYQFFPRHFLNWSGISQPALLASLLAVLWIAISVGRHYQSVESSLLWSVISIAMALRTSASSDMGALCVACAGFLIILAVLENSYRMAYRDELTGLPSRRALNEALLKLGNSYTLAMVDVDHFKRFNDTYGHDAGDQALKMVASKLARVTGGGKAYRYGGEEFTVVFPDTPAGEAFGYLDELRRLIAQSRFMVRGGERRRAKKSKPSRNETKVVNVTISVGIAACHGNAFTIEEVLRSADQALYKAKASGRNCTVVAKPRKSVRPAQPAARILQVG